MDDRTIKFYDQYAEEFFKATVNADVSGLYERFLQYIPEEGHILDLGCGSGRDSKNFIDRGYKVESVDGSSEMCRLASDYIGQKVRCCRFDDIDYRDEFDGIWACSSLLHVRKEEMKKLLPQLAAALKCGGVLYASFKNGNEEKIEGGRFYSHYTLDELRELAEAEAGMRLQELFLSEDVCPGRTRQWINIILKKFCQPIE